jgi:protein-L-isoaspartate(D-aspartate) O-methyltransferase
MHAYCLEALYPYLKENSKVLDIGSGSGIFTAYIAHLVSLSHTPLAGPDRFGLQLGPTGRVIGIDHIPELVRDSVVNLGKHHQSFLDARKIKMVVGDGRHGYAPEAPYDCIHVGAAFAIAPDEILSQLNIGGVLVAPIGTYNQNLVAITRTGETTFAEVGCFLKPKGPTNKLFSLTLSRTQKTLMGVRYVPMTSPEAQLRYS